MDNAAAVAEPQPAVVVEDDMPRLPLILTVKQVADRLGITTVTVRRYINEGYLRAYTDSPVWFISSEDYLTFRREVWPALGKGKQGAPKKGHRRADLSMAELGLLIAMDKATRRGRK